MLLLIIIMLIIIGIILLLYDAIRFRTKKRKSWTEIIIRFGVIIVFFGVLSYLTFFKHVSNDKFTSIEFIMLSIFLFGEVVYDRQRIKALKAKLRNN